MNCGRSRFTVDESQFTKAVTGLVLIYLGIYHVAAEGQNLPFNGLDLLLGLFAGFLMAVMTGANYTLEFSGLANRKPIGILFKDRIQHIRLLLMREDRQSVERQRVV